jgi:uncharacterized membrane protein
MEKLPKRDQRLHQMFELGVILKGLHAILELTTGFAVLALSPAAVSNFFFALARRTGSYDSHDLLANFLMRSGLRILNGGQHFAAIYLIVHGVINMGLVIGLLDNALWSYPVSVVAIALFMAYQVYRYTHTHALILVLLTVYDAVVCWLVWHEYGLRRKAPAG